MDKIMSGKECSIHIKEQIKNEISNIDKKLKLAVIRIGEDEASKVYVNSKRRACEEVGIEFSEVHFDDNVTNEEVEKKIIELNNDESVTSILMQLPIPKHLDKDYLINKIDYKKDVDGLTLDNIGRLNDNMDSIIPCTPSGIIELLKYYKVNLEGKHVVVIGRSNLVGKPLIPLLLNENATLTICHSKTENLETYTKCADILISAVGKKGLITSNMVKDNSVIIDVGITRDIETKKIYGDVDFEVVYDSASKITPVPGGVGVMTVTCLLKNVLKCYELQKQSKLF